MLQSVRNKLILLRCHIFSMPQCLLSSQHQVHGPEQGILFRKDSAEKPAPGAAVSSCALTGCAITAHPVTGQPRACTIKVIHATFYWCQILSWIILSLS